MHWFLFIISKPQNLLISNHNTSPKRKNIWTEVSCIGLPMAYWGQKSHSLMHKAQESVVCEIMECLMRQKSVVKLPTVRARWWACEHGNGAARPGSVRARARMYVCVRRTDSMHFLFRLANFWNSPTRKRKGQFDNAHGWGFSMACFTRLRLLSLDFKGCDSAGSFHQLQWWFGDFAIEIVWRSGPSFFFRNTLSGWKFELVNRCNVKQEVLNLGLPKSMNSLAIASYVMALIFK